MFKRRQKWLENCAESIFLKFHQEKLFFFCIFFYLNKTLSFDSFGPNKPFCIICSPYKSQSKFGGCRLLICRFPLNDATFLQSFKNEFVRFYRSTKRILQK
uniref:(northern house mosquito) hypothetical protein n=1 Tax=Culex pipiens TaxID=7175 RepID=A0A8D8G2P4_CULPI